MVTYTLYKEIKLTPWHLEQNLAIINLISSSFIYEFSEDSQDEVTCSKFYNFRLFQVKNPVSNLKSNAFFSCSYK